MSRWTLRILAPLALLAPLAGSAEAGVGDSSGGALSPFGRLSLVQTVQYGGDCWYDNGANGPGYYPCGDEWNNALGGGAPIVGPAIRRHHRRGVVVAHPQAQNPVYPGAPSRRLGAGGVRASPNFHAGAATGTPGFAGGGFHGGGNFHQFRGAGVPHIGAPSRQALLASGFPAPAARSELRTSARQPRQVLLASGLSMPAARSELRTSARRPRQALRASGLSVPAARSELRISARRPRRALPAAGFMALERVELSRGLRTASDIAEARRAVSVVSRLLWRSPRRRQT